MYQSYNLLPDFSILENIYIIIPEGETEETTTHDTLGADKISFDKVYNKCIGLLSN